MFSVPDIQNYFKYIIKKHKALTNKPPIQKYVKRTQNRVSFKIKSGNYLELLTPTTMKIIGGTGKNDELKTNVPQVGITEVLLVHCNIVDNQYQYGSRVLFTFAPNA